MNCQEFKQQMFALIDQELTVEDECECRHHLSTCEDCRTIVERETKIEKMIVKACMKKAPKTLKTRLLEAIKKAQALASGSKMSPLLDEGLL